jgi:hypothetical protein
MEGSVRGFHSTITPLVLPETLPNHVSEAMVTRFRELLSEQLLHLSSQSPDIPRQFKHYRNTSESSYSVSSSNESVMDYTDELFGGCWVNRKRDLDKENSTTTGTSSTLGSL